MRSTREKNIDLCEQTRRIFIRSEHEKVTQITADPLNKVDVFLHLAAMKLGFLCNYGSQTSSLFTRSKECKNSPFYIGPVSVSVLMFCINDYGSLKFIIQLLVISSWRPILNEPG
jgi:hypothetical protein